VRLKQKETTQILYSNWTNLFFTGIQKLLYIYARIKEIGVRTVRNESEDSLSKKVVPYEERGLKETLRV
jgi:hypothetical protein